MNTFEITLRTHHESNITTVQQVIVVEQEPKCLKFREMQRVWEDLYNSRSSQGEAEKLTEEIPLSTSQEMAYQKCMKNQECNQFVTNLFQKLKMTPCFKQGAEKINPQNKI